MDGPFATNARHLWRDPDQLRALCEAHGAGTRVTAVADGAPDWSLGDDGRWRHRRADYFDIGAYVVPGSGEVVTLMSQPRGVVVMLLLACIENRLAALLCLRSEPGLIGMTNLTSTIQSTPTNYRRQHGGKATPFIEIADAPQAFGEILHDSEQYDWGDYYRAKTKRFLAVRLREAVDAPAGYCWVPMDAARGLLAHDHLLTNDLRVLLSVLLGPRSRAAGVAAAPAPVLAGEDACASEGALQPLPMTPDFVDARGIRVGYFRTVTETREVGQWVQPLITVPAPLRLHLLSARRDGEPVFALRRATQRGLAGARLWLPAEAEDVEPQGMCSLRRVSTSAEGGRFWQHLIVLTWRDLPGDRCDAVMPPSSPARDVTWMTREEVSALVVAPLASSLELRMLWSLVVAASRNGGGAG